MTKDELREKVQRAIDGAYLDLGSRLAAEVVVAIVGKACAEMLRADRLTDPWSVECLADHWAKAILALTQETPDAG